MSRESDTLAIIRDSGEKQVTVLSATVIYSSGRSWRSGTTAVWTGTCLVFPSGGRFTRAPNGEQMVSTHKGYLPLSSTVAVGNQLVETGQTEYYLVEVVKTWEDHRELLLNFVEGR